MERFLYSVWASQAKCVTLVVQGAAEVWSPKESKGGFLRRSTCLSPCQSVLCVLPWQRLAEPTESRSAYIRVV